MPARPSVRTATFLAAGVVLILALHGAVAAADRSEEDLRNQLESASGVERVHVLNELARAAVTNDPGASIEYASEAVDLAARLGDDEGMVRSLNNLGIGHYYRSEYESALRRYSESLELATAIADEEGEARALNNIGVIHYVRGDYDRSLEYYDRALSIAKRRDDRESVAKGYNNLGNVYHAAERYEEALRYYEESLETYEELGLDDFIVNTLNNISLVYHELEQYDAALERLQRALTIARRDNHKPNLALSLNHLGMIHETQGRLEEAMASYEQSLAVRRELEDLAGVAIGLHNVGLIYLKRGDHEGSLRYLQDALDVVEQVGVREIERDIHLGLSEVHAARGDYQDALESYQRYKQVNDRLFDAEVAEQMAKLESRHAVESKDREIELLLKDQQFERLLRNVILAGISGLVILVLLLYNRYRLKDRANREMRRANEALKLAQREREKAARAELAHMSRVSIMGELASTLAHELNQPLTAILGNAQAARRMAAAESADALEVDDALGDIAGDAKRASEIIARMRRLIRRGDVTLESLDIGEVLAEIEVIARADVTERQFKLVFELAPGLPPVRGDRIQLQQVLLNLVHNAADAMTTTGATGDEILVTTFVDERGRVFVAVRDSGTAVDTHTVERMFEPFFTTKPEGLGMGLSICRTIVEAHGGRLWAVANPSGGLTVSFSLPCDDSGAERPGGRHA